MTTARAIFEKMMAQDHCSQWMGIEPLLLDEGHCRLRMTVKKQMLNGFGLLHGGMAYAFADSAFAFASNSYGRMAVSIQGSMHFARSAHEGDILLAEAKALHVSHKTADFDVNVWAETDPDHVMYYFRGTVYRSSRSLLDDAASST
jgi:acyl-CoA thioesterase